jgi:hypothetical protein
VTLRLTTRTARATVFALVCLGLVAMPAGAAAKAKHHAKKKPAPATAVKYVAGSTAPATGLGDTTGLNPATQLTAMHTGLAAAPAYFGRDTGCQSVTAMITSIPGDTLAGNFRDAFGGCYVWLNLKRSSTLTGSEICKTTLHEFGHLAGLAHSDDPSDVMFAPFRSDPIPGPCQVATAAGSAAR